MSTELPLSAVTLIYTDDDGTEYIQSLSDIEQVGTLIDPRTDDDLTLDRVVVDQPTLWCAVNRFCDELGDLSRRPNRPVIPTGFWPQITHQLAAIVYHRPTTFEGVRRILLDPLYDDITAERNRNGVRHFGPDAAFFAGSGGDETLMRALADAGWQIGTEKASYWYTMTHPATGETLTYTEGDIELGDRITDR